MRFFGPRTYQPVVGGAKVPSRFVQGFQGQSEMIQGIFVRVGVHASWTCTGRAEFTPPAAAGYPLAIRYRVRYTPSMDLLTTAEAAEELGIKAARVRQLCQTGVIVGERKGRDWLIPRSSLARARKRPTQAGWRKGRKRKPVKEST